MPTDPDPDPDPAPTDQDRATLAANHAALVDVAATTASHQPPEGGSPLQLVQGLAPDLHDRARAWLAVAGPGRHGLGSDHAAAAELAAMVGALLDDDDNARTDEREAGYLAGQEAAAIQLRRLAWQLSPDTEPGTVDRATLQAHAQAAQLRADSHTGRVRVDGLDSTGPEYLPTSISADRLAHTGAVDHAADTIADEIATRTGELGHRIDANHVDYVARCVAERLFGRPIPAACSCKGHPGSNPDGPPCPVHAGLTDQPVGLPAGTRVTHPEHGAGIVQGTATGIDGATLSMVRFELEPGKGGWVTGTVLTDTLTVTGPPAAVAPVLTTEAGPA